MSRPANSHRLPITVVLEDPRLPYPYQAGGAFNAFDRADLEQLKETLLQLPGYSTELLDSHDELAAALARRRPRFVFNLCDTGFRNRGELEAHIPALLEMLDIPYSGTAPPGLYLCRDKSLVRALGADLGVPVPVELYLDGAGPDALEDFPYPAIVKPNLEEGSRGLSTGAVVDSPRAAAARLDELRRELPGSPLLLQEFLDGAEYSVGLIGNLPDLRVLPIVEVDYRHLDPDLPPILAFEYKNDPSCRYGSQLRYRRSRLAPATAAELESHSRRLFGRLGCRDYARIDYRRDRNGRIKLLEVNPNPACSPRSTLHTMAKAAGYDYARLLGLLLEAGLARTGVRA